jgi:hypothetical protein
LQLFAGSTDHNSTSKGTNQHTTASISKRVISLKEGNGNLKKIRRQPDLAPYLNCNEGTVYTHPAR